jgi:hypothetical protein
VHNPVSKTSNQTLWDLGVLKDEFVWHLPRGFTQHFEIAADASIVRLLLTKVRFGDAPTETLSRRARNQASSLATTIPSM